MAVLKIDILTRPDQDCRLLESRLKLAVALMKLPAEIKRTSNFAAFTGCAINPSQVPAVIINGNVEFAGDVPDLEMIRHRLEEIRQGF